MQLFWLYFCLIIQPHLPIAPAHTNCYFNTYSVIQSRQCLRQRDTKSKYINQCVKRFQEIDKTHKCIWRKREKSNESLTHWLESQALQNAKREEILAMITEIWLATVNERSVNAWLLAMVMRHQPADSLRLSLQLIFGVFFVFFLRINYRISWVVNGFYFVITV